MTTNDPPRRAVTIDLRMGADTKADLVASLYRLAEMIDRGDIRGPSGCSGGCTSGYSYEFTVADHPTHDEYIAKLNEYLGKNL